MASWRSIWHSAGMNLTAEYDNRALVPDHPRIILDWLAEAKAYRERARCDLDISYGAASRNKLDIFHPEAYRRGPVVVFIHGGYWRSFDKSVFSHMAAGANAHGLTVAVPSYTLCPEVTIPDIIEELRQCCLFLGNLSTYHADAPAGSNAIAKPAEPAERPPPAVERANFRASADSVRCGRRRPRNWCINELPILGS